jgi:phosphoglycerate dehydrogenase-like enzyme
MRFKKIFTIGISESSFDVEYWKKIDALTEKRAFLQKDSSEIITSLNDVDCLLVNPFVFKVEKEYIDAAPKLKYIGVLATAYAKVDCAYAASKGIAVTNIPGYSTEAVAEFVFAILLEHLRELEKGKIQARKGNYSEAGFSATEIKNKKFGILGLGRIGGRVAEIALGFGADVRYWSRNRKKEFEVKGIKYEDVDRLIANSDFLSLHFAQTKETELFLNEKRIQRLKKGAIVINTAPMELIDISALEKRLSKEDITFILDHSDEMSEENLKKLSKYKNFIIYPPIAYVTKEARIAKQKIFVENIENFLKGTPINKVN